VVCDVFTDTPLEGNQLGVFPDARDLSGERMQKLAKELNYSESTFVLPPVEGGDARIRIFTPKHEIPFAGHPTLGTAHVLADRRGMDEVRLETGNGIIPVRFEREGSTLAFGRMEQPVPVLEPFADVAGLLIALGVEGPALPVEAYDNGIRHVYVALRSEEAVAELRPDLAQLSAQGDLTVNCFTGSGIRWKTRVFAPAHGVAEDPATGSAAGPLAFHLARHGSIAWGEEIEIRQGAEIGRPSRLYARVTGAADRVERVEVGGSVVVVAHGEFVL
jgi:trans-2,3-dihydro-3-hydroxyanthranilate isomerase